MKTRFLQKEYDPDHYTPQGGNTWVEIVFAKPKGQARLLQAGSQTLFLRDPVKKFASDRNEWVFKNKEN